MKRLIFSFTLFFLMGISLPVLSAENKYVGVKKCKTCHISKKKGAQYKVWEKMKHAQAYNVLGTKEAKKIAADRGLKTDPQKSPECLKCHTTLYDPKTGKKRENVEDSLKKENGVGCESCHGPGSKYKTKATMSDHKKFIEAGGMTPTEKTCIQCHNEESPSYKEFNYKERYKKIAHPRPKK